MNKRRKKLKIIDLFSGAGGFGLGAKRAGFDIAGSIEIDPQAISVHKTNFPKSPLWERDISTLSGPEMLKSLLIPLKTSLSWLCPEDQNDMIAETTFDFYSLIAKQLDTEIFKAINFFFVSASDE